MNQKIGLVILPAPKQDGSGLEYMNLDAGIGLSIPMRDVCPFRSHQNNTLEKEDCPVLFFLFVCFNSI